MISISSQVQTADEIELSADLIRLLPIGLICVYSFFFIFTVQILCIGTDRSQQTVQTKIRLLLKKQSDQGLRCLPFHQHLLDALMQCYIKLFYFKDNYGNCLRCPKF